MKSKTMSLMKVKKMSDFPVCIDLSEELSRLMFTSGNDNGLSLIRSIPDLSAKARGNCLTLGGPVEKVRLVKQFVKVLNSRVEKHEDHSFCKESHNKGRKNLSDLRHTVNKAGWQYNWNCA